MATDLVPRLRESLRDCRLLVVGSQPTAAIRQLSSLHTIVTGYVEDLRPYYDQCRVFVAPIRFGSGISCKVVEAMANGIPAVVSPLVAKGLGLVHEREVLIGGDDDEFVGQVVRLYTDTGIWQRLQHNGTAFVRRNCSPSAMRETLGEILNLTGVRDRDPSPREPLLSDLVDLAQ